MKVLCTQCKRSSVMDDDVAGKIVDCPVCDEPFRVAAEDDGRKHCLNCAARMVDDSVICLECGFNYDTGDFLRTILAKENEVLPLWHTCLNRVADVFPGLFKPKIIISATACFAASLFMMYFGLLLLVVFRVVFSGVALTAFALVTYAQAISLMLTGAFERLSYAMGEFETVHWWVFLILIVGPFVTVILLFMQYGAQLSS